MTNPAMPAPGPTVGYVVLAHKSPPLLRGLLARLGEAPVFLHIDRRTKPAVHAAMTKDLSASVTLLPRRRTRWGGLELVRAEFDGLRAALAAGADFIVVMTGQDTPLVSPREIIAFCRDHHGRSFYAISPLPVRYWGPDGGMKRFRHHNLALGPPWPIERFRIPIRRRLPKGLKLWSGNAYHLLAASHARAILALLDRRPELERFWRSVWIPDESFVATLLMNSVPRDEVVNENLWFIEWNEGGLKHPRVLDESHFERLQLARILGGGEGGQSRVKLFARKIDLPVSASLLHRLAEVTGV